MPKSILFAIIIKVNKILTSKYQSRPVNFTSSLVILTSEKKLF
jgi:hypothetical protein